MEGNCDDCGRDACSGEKRHPCCDCRYCQWCSDDRCRLCLREKRSRRKLSLSEQIELYESINGQGGTQ